MSDGFQISPQGSSFDEFHSRHRDSEGKRLGWMVDFYRAKEGVIHYRKADLKWRVLELAKQTSWGNKNRDYMADPNGHPLSQRQIASTLRVDYQRVSEAIEELVAEGFLARKGRVILVVDDPEAARAAGTKGKQKAKANPPRPGLSGEERVKFLAFWKERDPEQFQRYQKIGEEIEEKFREQRELSEAAWKAYQDAQERKSGTGWTTNNNDPQRSGQNVRNGMDKTSGTERTGDEAILIGFTSTSNKLASFLKDEPETLVEKAVVASGLQILYGNRARAIRNAAARLAGTPPEQRTAVLQKFESDCKQLAKRRENKPKNWGIVVSAMEDASTEATRKPPATATAQKATDAAPAITDQINSLEQLLETAPNHPQAESWRAQLEALKRKPAESELEAKAMKAGNG